MQLLLLILALAGVSAADASDDNQGWKVKPLSILVVSTTDPGHLISMAALGGALARRGHNVSLCTTERERFDRGEFVAKAGMHYISAGRDLYYSEEEVLKFHSPTLHTGIVSTARELVRQFSQFAELFHKRLSGLGNWWDVVIVDVLLYPVVACHVEHHQWNARVITAAPNGCELSVPQWSFPSPMSDYTDDLDFFQRLHTEITRSTIYPVTMYALVTLQCMDSSPSYYLRYAGTLHPLIVFNAIGLEYSRTSLPMVHYVGPVVPQSSKELPAELEEWLTGKGERSVVYISMGSSVILSKDVGNAIVDGILGTGFNVIWSLRESNRDFLEGRQLEPDRFLVSDWLPQQAVLKSSSIAVSIVHGGMGGVAESLMQAVPLIVIPFGKDQPSNAARVQSSGAGIYLNKETLTAKAVQGAIEAVASPEYRKAAEKLRKIFLQAGGLEMASDLVEFYTEIGYEHLIPAYAKYQWSWVQYYNVDVFGFIAVVIFVFGFVTFKICACACRWCRRKPKTD